MSTAFLLSVLSALACTTAGQHAIVFVSHVEGGAENLMAELETRSDPDSSQYLQWLSQDEVHAILQPNMTHLATIVSLASQHGLSSTIAHDKVSVSSPSNTIPDLFLEAVRASGAADLVSSSVGKPAFALSSTKSTRTRGPANPNPDRKSNPNHTQGLRNLTRTAVVAPDLDKDLEMDKQACLSDLNGVTPFRVPEVFLPSQASHIS